MKKINDLIYRFAMTVCKRRCIVSFLISIIVFWLYFNQFLKDIKDILPNVITFASILLAVLSINFSLFPTIIDSERYEKIKKDFSESILELNNLVKNSVLLSIAVVLYSFLLIALNLQVNIWVKGFLCFLGSYLFILMTITSLGSFLLIFYLYSNTSLDN